MRTPPCVLVADDSRESREILRIRLSSSGYRVLIAHDGQEALNVAGEYHPDLILLDVMMPKIDGIEVCRRLKADTCLPFIPVIMITAKAEREDIVAGLEAGADEYLTKPVDQVELVARVKSMLRIKSLNETVREQTKRLEAQAAELASWNKRLEERVFSQQAELERLSHLKRFFPPNVARLIASPDHESIMRSHRREITVVVCDLRGFTPFAETAEPEEVMAVLNEYHSVVGPLTFQYEATLEHMVGDGVTAFFNDPFPCPDPVIRAVRMAVEIRSEIGRYKEIWHKRGHNLGLGVGLAMGYATLGQIGFEGQFHYGAIGPVLNLASRLCDIALSGQILVSQRVQAELDGLAETELVGDLTPKGFQKSVRVYSIVSLRE